MPSINVQQGTTLQNMQNTFSDTNDNKLLRVNEGETSLHTKSFGFSGIGQEAATRREEKYQRAVDTVKTQIDQQFGKGVGDKIFNSLNITDRMTVGDLKAITRELYLASTDSVRHDLGRELGDDIFVLKQQILSQYGEMDDVPNTQKANQGTDPIRTNMTAKKSINNMQSVVDGSKQIRDMDVDQTSDMLMQAMKQNKVVSTDKISSLMELDCVSKAAGDLTALNTFGRQPVKFEPTQEQIDNLGLEKANEEVARQRDLSMHQGAVALKIALEDTLSTEELAHFKSQAKFVRDLAELQVQKVGFCSGQGDSDELKINQWIKSNSVNCQTFLGFDSTSLAKETDLNTREMMVAARDLLTAMAMHYDTIFDD